MTTRNATGGMNIEEVFRGIKVFEKAGKRAPHKPLLLLLTIGRILRGEPRLVLFAEIQEPLRRLLMEFGPPRKTIHPEYPFWWLRSDGIWDVESDGPMVPRTGHRDPRKSELIAKHAMGGLTEDIYGRLKRDPQEAIRCALVLCEKSFPETVWPDVLSAAGIDFEGLLKPRKRDVAFRSLILEAYRFQCCVCGLKLQLGPEVFGVEAAHIKWHQAHGPDITGNGLALCVLHHKAFDRGAWTLDDAYRVQVSKSLHGNSAAYSTYFEQYQGRSLCYIPSDEQERPGRIYLEWHRKQVFRLGATPS